MLPEPRPDTEGITGPQWTPSLARGLARPRATRVRGFSRAKRSGLLALLDAIPAAALRFGGKLNVPVYRATRGRLFGRIGRAPVLLLTTTGRRSGIERTAPVLYMADG